MDPGAYNYNENANIDDGECEPFVYGCTDNTMFNYNPAANAEYDPSNCEPYIYGCTDPSMLNYNSSANTEDFSCIPYIYGCTDPTALNYDELANTDNGSCIEVLVDCMDPDAFNYNELANTSDEEACLYDAECIGGPVEPYWLNDGCYAWIIDIDPYCCEVSWDETCVDLYSYCEQGWPQGVLETTRNINVYPNPTNDLLNIPVIASGGVGSIKHFYEGVKIGKADALLAASVFHFNEFSIMDVKNYLKEKNIEVRI